MEDKPATKRDLMNEMNNETNYETNNDEIKRETNVLSSYFFKSENIPVNVRIIDKGGYVPTYELTIPGLAEGTKIVLNTLKGELITKVKLDITEIIDPKKESAVKQKFETYALYLLQKQFPSLTEDKRKVLSSYLIQSTLGLDELEPPLHDENLEEICVNNAQEPVWVYHKKYGWCKSNVWIRTEDKIYDYSAMIGRKIGRQINVLNPLMDAHLTSGDRVNSTLYPISSFGNTITIRKFSKNPWTIPVLVANKTTSPEVAALIWLCVQNELSLIISGGTGSGKTSFLNAVAGLIPPNQRVISIEDTRELTLPSFLHWVPMSTREPNPEGKGEISMLDLMVNSLRMRPDRILVGEVRRKREAEILMEAMHTGHSVYSTFHADNAEQALTRLTNPPIDIPSASINALAGFVVQFRHRRLGIRRTLEFAEIQKGGDLNTLYRWDIKKDAMTKTNRMVAMAETLSLYAGLSYKEIEENVKEKADVIKWMVKHNHMKVDEVGHIISRYYFDSEQVLKYVKKDKPWDVF